MANQKTDNATKSGSTLGAWIDDFRTVIWAIVIALGIRTFAFEPFNIPSGSMIPTLLVGVLSFALIEIAPEAGPTRRKSYVAVLIEGGRYFLEHPVLRLLSLDLAITNALVWFTNEAYRIQVEKLKRLSDFA